MSEVAASGVIVESSWFRDEDMDDPMSDRELTERKVRCAEYAVLAAMLNDPGVAKAMTNALRFDHFISTDHREIFRAMVAVLDAGGTPDLFSVALELRARNLLRAPLCSMMEAFSFPLARGVDEALWYAAPLIKARKDREVRLTAMQAVEDGKSADEIRALVDARSDDLASEDPVPATLLRDDAADAVDAIGVQDTRIATGFAGLDVALDGGFERGEFVVLGARPGMGKTTFALNMLGAMRGYSAAFYSMEMTRGKIGIMASQIIANTRLEDIYHFGDERADFANELRRFGNLKVYTLYPATLTPQQAAVSIRQLVMQRGVRFVVIDNLALMTDPAARKHGRVQEISSITRTLKALAMELNITIMTLAQLNRQSESREDSRPLLTDLRDSGSIEQDADVVAFLWRASYQKTGTRDPGDKTEFITRKSRGRSLRTVEFYFDPSKEMYTEAIR